MADPRLDASFYFDLASPEAYLAAERWKLLLPPGCEWQPVLARELAPADDAGAVWRASLERRAAEHGLQPLVWPDPFPFDSELAMLVATYAKRIGRSMAFALAAFRQAFAGGHELSTPDHVLIAAAACEMHPTAVLRAAGTRSVRDGLRQATEEAAALGIETVPTVRFGGQTLVGEQELEQAATSGWKVCA